MPDIKLSVHILAENLRSFSSKMKRGLRSVKNFSDGVVNVAKKTAMFSAGLAAAGYAVERFAMRGAKIRGVTKEFENLSKKAGLAADDFLTQLKTATQGALDEYKLMQRANQALISNVKPDIIIDMMGYLKRYADRTGKSLTSLATMTFNGLTRTSGLFLDDVGLMINETELYKQKAIEIGRALTVEEKRMAFFAKVRSEIAEKGAKFTDDTKSSLTAIGKINTKIVDTFNNAAVFIDKVLEKAGVYEDVAKWLDKLYNKFKVLVQDNGIINSTKNLIKELFSTLKDLLLFIGQNIGTILAIVAAFKAISIAITIATAPLTSFIIAAGALAILLAHDLIPGLKKFYNLLNKEARERDIKKNNKIIDEAIIKLKEYGEQYGITLIENGKRVDDFKEKLEKLKKKVNEDMLSNKDALDIFPDMPGIMTDDIDEMAASIQNIDPAARVAGQSIESLIDIVDQAEKKNAELSFEASEYNAELEKSGELWSEKILGKVNSVISAVKNGSNDVNDLINKIKNLNFDLKQPKIDKPESKTDKGKNNFDKIIDSVKALSKKELAFYDEHKKSVLGSLLYELDSIEKKKADYEKLNVSKVEIDAWATLERKKIFEDYDIATAIALERQLKDYKEMQQDKTAFTEEKQLQLHKTISALLENTTQKNKEELEKQKQFQDDFSESRRQRILGDTLNELYLLEQRKQKFIDNGVAENEANQWMMLEKQNLFSLYDEEYKTKLMEQYQAYLAMEQNKTYASSEQIAQRIALLDSEAQAHSSRTEGMRVSYSDMANGLANAITSIVTKTEKAGTAIKKFVFKTLASIAGKLGDTLIYTGFGIKALEKLSGGAAIAAGIALKVLSGVISGMFSEGASMGSSAESSGTDIGVSEENIGVAEQRPVVNIFAQHLSSEDGYMESFAEKLKSYADKYDINIFGGYQPTT